MLLGHSLPVNPIKSKWKGGMKLRSNTKWALGVSLFALIGFPVIFLFISLLSGQWNYLIISIFPSFSAGLTGLIISLQQLKKERNYN